MALGSKEEQGSSIRMISGFMAMVLAMHSLCCCPPERVRAKQWRRSLTSSHKAAFFKELSTSSSGSNWKPLILGPPEDIFDNGFWKGVRILKNHPYFSTQFNGIDLLI